MPRARLTITLPGGVWVRDVSTAFPDARFRVLAALPDGETGVGLVAISGPDVPAVVEATAAHDAVTALDVLGRHGDEALVRFETDAPILLFPARESGVPIEPPVEIRDGTATLDVTASRARLSALGDQLRAFDLDFRVEYVHRSLAAEPLLTDTQRALVTAAVEHGYYDTPRETTLTELAEAVGIAKSTASETLHRAEGSIVKQYVDDLPELPGDE